jgi:NAD(P)-dependent dehydrogenase (short-subunit alcohol dehydrogenase family)
MHHHRLSLGGKGACTSRSDPDRYGRPDRCQTARNLGASARLVGPPIGRLGTPDDMAKGIVFLASDDAAFMTWAGLVVDGRLTAQ